MKIVPVIKCSHLQRSLHFYTKVLENFDRKWPGYEDREMANEVIDLVRGGAELQLSRHAGDGALARSTACSSTTSMSGTWNSAAGNWTRRTALTLRFTLRQSIKRGDCANLR